MRVSVVVPSYRRPDRLKDCLAALAAQTRPADEVLVVCRRDDEATRAAITGGAREVLVDVPGLVAATFTGLRAATGDVVAVTDDDAVPRPDWVSRIADHFTDPTLGILGGRDLLQGRDPAAHEYTVDVGRINGWGRLVGNHHLGTGGFRDVDVVKQVNMALRPEAAAVPIGLRGTGSQPHSEVALCGWATSRGWRIAYDPDLLVEHYPAERPAGDRRTARHAKDMADEAHNLVTAVLSGRPELLWRRAGYGLLVGDREVPGLLRAAYALLRGDIETVVAMPPSVRGQLAALRDHLRGRRLVPTPVVDGAEPLRVTLVAHDVHEHGGMERALAELLRRAGRRVAFTVVASDLAPHLRPHVVRWQRVRVPRRPFPLRFAAFYVLAGLRLRRLGGQLVHTCGAIVPNRVDVATIHLCHAGVVSSTGRLAPPDGSLPRRLNTALTRVLSILAERWTYGRPRAQALAVVSPGLRREVLEHYTAAPVRLTPNGVDTDRFAPDPAVRAAVRATHGVSDAEVVALFVGGDWARKGLRTAIEALALTGRADTRLWVVGPGDEGRYRAFADRLGVGDRVTFFGSRVDTEAFYRGADLLVLPTAYETFSLVAHEAAAAGLPVVVTAVSGADDLIGADEAGVLVERTPGSVAAALVRLAGDPELRARLGAEGRLRVAGRSWEASVDEVVGVYREVAGAR